jgi:hypothetical protein
MSNTGYLLLLITMLAGCGGAPRKGETLLESVQTYHEGIRWTRIPSAAGRIPAAERGEFVSEWDELSEDLRITDYEVMEVTAGKSDAAVRVKYTWYLVSRGIVHESQSLQRWEHHGPVWLKVEEKATKGPPMPGLGRALDAVTDAGSGAVLDTVSDPVASSTR